VRALRLDGAGSANGANGSGSATRAPGNEPVESLLYLAPAALESGSVLAFDGDSDHNAVLEILSAKEIPGGTYIYERLSATTARVSYVLFVEGGVVETGEIFLDFASHTSGVYTHVSAEGETEVGEFELELPEATE
jgi:hypothetical protein